MKERWRWSVCYRLDQDLNIATVGDMAHTSVHGTNGALSFPCRSSASMQMAWRSISPLEDLMKDVLVAAKMREFGLAEHAVTHKESAGYLLNDALDQIVLRYGLILGNYLSKPFSLSPKPSRYYPSILIPRFEL